MSNKKRATPRELPMAGFGAPFAEFAAAARHFLTQAESSSERVSASLVTHDVGDREIRIPSPSALFAAQRDSAATQVFAGMAVEAAINTFGVIHFGHDQFERAFGFGSLRDKLTGLLQVSLSKEVPSSVVEMLESLNGKRNALVHSRPSEMSPNSAGVMSYREPRLTRRVELAAAVEAVDEMTEIVRWLAELDYQAYPFLQEWPDALIRPSQHSDTQAGV